MVVSCVAGARSRALLLGRAVGAGGQGGGGAVFLQLTLSQQRVADYAHHNYYSPPDFQTFLQPYLAKGHENVPPPHR